MKQTHRLTNALEKGTFNTYIKYDHSLFKPKIITHFKPPNMWYKNTNMAIMGPVYHIFDLCLQKDTTDWISEIGYRNIEPNQLNYVSTTKNNLFQLVGKKNQPKLFLLLNEFDKYAVKHKAVIKEKKHQVIPIKVSNLVDLKNIVVDLESKLTYKSDERGMVRTLFASVIFLY